MIRNCAIVLYFQPFSTIRLERMGQAFGWTIDEVEQQVVTLIQSGQINGRVDSQNKVSTNNSLYVTVLSPKCFQILKAKKTDYRAELFARAIKAGDDMRNANKKLLFRMRL
jgi:COP9 signalosome complex subunit 1